MYDATETVSITLTVAPKHGKRGSAPLQGCVSNANRICNLAAEAGGSQEPSDSTYKKMITSNGATTHAFAT